MRVSFQMILAGVGAIVPISYTMLAMAAPVSAQSQHSSLEVSQSAPPPMVEPGEVADPTDQVGQAVSLSLTAPVVSIPVQPTSNIPVRAVRLSQVPPATTSRSASPATTAEAVRAAKKASLLKGQAQPAQQPNGAGTTAQSLPQSPTTPTGSFILPEPEIEPLGKPIGPAKSGSAPAYLNPVPNPLAVPVLPKDVKLRGIQPITLQQALELAERNNLAYQVSALQLQRSRAALRQAQADLYPTLGVQANVVRSVSPAGELAVRAGANNPFAPPQNEPSRTFSGTATLNYDVFTFGRRTAQIRAAEQQVRVDQLGVDVARAQLRLDVTNAYYDLQSADANVRIRQAAVRNAQISLRDAQAQERAGIGTRFDVLRAQVQLANSQQDLVNATSQQQVNRRQLARRLNINSVVDLAAADPVEAAGRWILSLEESIVLAFRNRAELEQLLAQREQANQQRKVALSSLKPTVSVTAQYQILDSLQDDLGVADGYTVQAGLRWNLFDGGAARASAAQAEVNAAIAETNFSDRRNVIRFDVEQSYSQLLANRDNIGTAEFALVQAREALRLARLRFQAGVGTQTEVINAETDLTNSQGNLVNAILGYNRALATLQRAITNLPIPTGQTSPPLAPYAPASNAPSPSGAGANFQTSPALNTIPSPTGNPAPSPGTGNP